MLRSCSSKRLQLSTSTILPIIIGIFLFFFLLLFLSTCGSTNNSKSPLLIHDRSFIALSSDDFGRWTDSVPLFPNLSFMQNHSNLIINTNFWYKYATVETRNDLQNLLSFFKQINMNTTFEQSVILTPHWIVGGPDFDAMRSNGCGLDSNQSSSYSSCVYKEQLLSDMGSTGLDQSPYYRGNLKDIYLKLWYQNIWHPEYHGRSHFSVSTWLNLLKTDSKTQECFENNLVCATDNTKLRSEFNGFQHKHDLKVWLEDGVNAFSAFWGYRPSLISSPHNTWNSWLSDVVLDLSFIGGELAEDQENYIHLSPSYQSTNSLSLHDRYRFDTFFPGFKCEKEIEQIIHLLKRPNSNVSSQLYSFFHLFDKTIKMEMKDMNHHRFISLMWHAQNIMSSTYNEEEYDIHMKCMKDVIDEIRKQVPRAVFLTGSELHQIRSKGWSQEIWKDHIILRNYAIHDIKINIPDLRDYYPSSSSWKTNEIIAKTLSKHGEDYQLLNDEEIEFVSVGESFTLSPDSVIKLMKHDEE